jgi:hexosaminidase
MAEKWGQKYIPDMNIKNTLAGILTLFAMPVLAAPATVPAIIPQPQSVECRDGNFELGPGTRIVTDATSKQTGQYLAERLRKATGFEVRLAEKEEPTAAKGEILLTTRNAKAELGAEGYELAVAKDSVIIRAPAQAGLFYGVQTLFQLLPSEVLAPKPVHQGAWTIPCLHVQDQPRFKWRGLMLDISRHFFNKDEIKQLLDAMVLHKINTFHWHLVDDQGWRIEIKKYPKLTQVGAWRTGIGFKLDPKSSTAYGPDGRYGGFFTQADIKEIIAYADARHITIVPEIEMPGHSVAALAAYPQFSCSGEPYSTDISAGVHAGVYCAGKDETFEFLQNVLAEVIDLFPSKYIHIGGDEVPKGNWKQCEKCQARMKQEGLKTEHELQSYFIRRIEKFINSKGRNLIGWSEIREGGLAQNAAVMDWIGGAVEAATDGHEVVMSPTSNCYFDFYQSQDQSTEPRAIGGFLPLSKVYAFEPIPAKLPEQFHHHILGAQGNIWTEYIPSLKHVEYMAFPRLAALSEVAWSPKAARNYDDFTRRLEADYQRLDRMGVNYRREMAAKIGEWTPSQISTQGVTLQWDVTKHAAAAGKYRVRLDYEHGAHGIRLNWVALLEDGKEVARDTHAGFTGSRPRQSIYSVNLPACKAGARYTIQAQVAGDGGTDSTGTVYWEPQPIKPALP